MVKDEKDRATWNLRITMTRASWSETAVLMGPFREIRMKKTAPRGIKDENDTRQLE